MTSLRFRDWTLIIQPHDPALEDVEIRYQGGRLAELWLSGQPTEAVQVRDYDWTTGRFEEPYPTAQTIVDRVAAFIDEAGGIDLYRRNA